MVWQGMARQGEELGVAGLGKAWLGRARQGPRIERIRAAMTQPEDTSMTNGIFSGGIPTEPDVRKLMEAFGKPAEGTKWAHQELAAVIKCDPKESRYKTVIDAWRAKLTRLHNIILIADPGVGLKVATPDDRVETGHRKMRTANRMTKRAFTVIGTTDLSRVSAENRAQAEKDLHVAKALMTAARVESNKFRVALPEPEPKE